MPWQIWDCLSLPSKSDPSLESWLMRRKLNFFNSIMTNMFCHHFWRQSLCMSFVHVCIMVALEWGILFHASEALGYLTAQTPNTSDIPINLFLFTMRLFFCNDHLPCPSLLPSCAEHSWKLPSLANLQTLICFDIQMHVPGKTRINFLPIYQDFKLGLSCGLKPSQDLPVDCGAGGREGWVGTRGRSPKHQGPL